MYSPLVYYIRIIRVPRFSSLSVTVHHFNWIVVVYYDYIHITLYMDPKFRLSDNRRVIKAWKIEDLRNKYHTKVLYGFHIHHSNVTPNTLTLRLQMSYIYGAPSKARNANVVYIWTYIWQHWNGLFLFAAQCFNTESMQRGFLCHICV